MDPSPGGQIRLRDGRRVGFAEFGDPEGRPVVYFHGFPGSRLEAGFGHEVATRVRVRLIGVDRPGYGLSDPKFGRTLIDWPDDVADLARALRIDRFSVLGVSGGGPYALACASKIPDRLHAVGLVGSLGPTDAPGALNGMEPFNRRGLELVARAPWVAGKAFLFGSFLLHRCPRWVMGLVATRAGEPDRSALRHSGLDQVLIRSFRESVRSGGRGAARDVVLFARPWGFALGNVRVPVHIWHGGRDRIVPLAMGEHLAHSIPVCRSHFHFGEGHFSILINHARDVLGTLCTTNA
jgi:pimeloyl-ACP methyl ester carboxylesterase